MMLTFIMGSPNVPKGIRLCGGDQSPSSYLTVQEEFGPDIPLSRVCKDLLLAVPQRASIDESGSHQDSVRSGKTEMKDEEPTKKTNEGTVPLDE
ncbi:hypothetical protein AVEN_237302-1 [Araneus ventricosus]|uniref:Uncharacterized protein n=1 Tax=Araneus ventricosus TaxID=182803 RepID=A0A4Y2DKK3_ARAVE|nr:hypothetical protein AVEN_237302-1 [Araneus ventricosus]